MISKRLAVDKAIKIIRETDEEAEVIPNLMIGFSIDEVQAEYIAEIKLRHLNREYIMKRLEETKSLEEEIADLTDTLGSDKKIKNVIISELKEVIKKYGQPRKTQFYYMNDVEEVEEEDDTPDYPVTLFLSASGYFKKITPLSLRMSSEQNYKEGDMPSQEIEATHKTELLFFSDKMQVYKTRASEFADTKASVLGDFIPAKLGFDEGENVKYMVTTSDYSGYMLFVFENGKAAKVPLNAYETKQNRRKLSNAYSGKSPLVKAAPDNQLVNLTFGRECVAEALISQASRKFEVNLSIVLANVDLLQDSPLGFTVVMAQGKTENIAAALDYLRASGVRVEVIDDGRNL